MSGTQQENTDLTGPWRKSTHSNQGDCVEVAPTAQGIVMRNSKDHAQGVLHFTTSELAAFVAGCKGGEFDDLL